MTMLFRSSEKVKMEGKKDKQKGIRQTEPAAFISINVKNKLAVHRCYIESSQTRTIKL